jgi:hypothetical protein
MVHISSRLITSVLTGADILYRDQFTIDSEGEAQMHREARSRHWYRRDVEEKSNSHSAVEDRGI